MRTLHGALVTAQVCTRNFNGPLLGTCQITAILKENIQPILDEKDAEIERLKTAVLEAKQDGGAE